MKGVTHFVTAVAAASMVHSAVDMAADGSFLLALAALGGLIPDLLDFRIGRYLWRPDVDIDPDPGHLDPQALAERLAAAIDGAWDSGRQVSVQLHTVRTAVDRWWPYRVSFGSNQVTVSVGPPIDGAQRVLSAASSSPRSGQASTAAKLHVSGDSSISVGTYDGAACGCRPVKSGVEVVTLPWHRRWSHSLLLTVAASGVLAWLLGPTYGLVYLLGAGSHILEDQLGHMGSSLFFPLVRSRIGGLQLLHSGDTLPNALAVWLGLALIFFNLDRFSPSPVLVPWRYLALAVVAPCCAMLLIARARRLRGHGHSPGVAIPGDAGYDEGDLD